MEIKGNYIAIFKNNETILQTMQVAGATDADKRKFFADVLRWSNTFPNDQISTGPIKKRAQAESINPITLTKTPAHGWER